MAVPLPLLPALNQFLEPITVFDTTGAYADGRWVETTGADRTIAGTFQPATRKQLQILPEGDASGGGFILITKEALNVADVRQGSQVAGQTYVRAYGDIWRVVEVGEWNVHTLTKTYICTKFIDRRESGVS